jgi:2-keto-3-deoxy-L-rhamnonate aldolase RhmA
MATNLLTKAKKGETALGIYIGDTDMAVAEIAAIAGFDYMRIDSEHALVNPSKLADTIRVANAYDVPTLVRISTLEEMTKLLDFGATGILVPDVRNREDAQAAVDTCKYYPVGKRGVNRSSRCGKYGAMSLDEYLKFAEENVCLCVQIESQEGIDNIDEILSVEGIDLVATGRQDLAQDFGLVGQTNHPRVEEAEDYIIKKALEYGKYPLITATSPKKYEELKAKGVLLMTACFDTQFILKAFKDHLAGYKK